MNDRPRRLDRLARAAAERAPADTSRFSTLSPIEPDEAGRPRYLQHWHDREVVHIGEVGETHDAMCGRLWPGCARFEITGGAVADIA